MQAKSDFAYLLIGGTMSSAGPRWNRKDCFHDSGETYHRGQVASKLKRFGIEQPITDFFFWAIEQVPQEA
jgi:hypothetical protein